MSQSHEDPPERLVPMEDWVEQSTGHRHVAFRMSDSGNVTTANKHPNHHNGWYGPIQSFLDAFKKIRERMHLL